MKAILERRSVRKYTDQPVSEQDIKDLLTAAMAAPSAGNARPWHFIVINDRQTLEEVPKFHQHATTLKQAPVAILVCADQSLEKFKGYWVQDCAAATENILIAATAKDLGTVWMGIYPTDEYIMKIQELLKIPENITPFSLVAVGHAAEDKEPPIRYDQSRVHHNQW